MNVQPPEVVIFPKAYIQQIIKLNEGNSVNAIDQLIGIKPQKVGHGYDMTSNILYKEGIETYTHGNILAKLNMHNFMHVLGYDSIMGISFFMKVDGPLFSEILPTLPVREYAAVLYQIFYVIYSMATKAKLINMDLHDANIMISNNRTLYTGITRTKIKCQDKEVMTDLVPVFIDYDIIETIESEDKQISALRRYIDSVLNFYWDTETHYWSEWTIDDVKTHGLSYETTFRANIDVLMALYAVPTQNRSVDQYYSDLISTLCTFL